MQIKITILGDICPTNDYQQLFDNMPDALFGDISTIAQQSDYTICNLECPATNSDKPIIKTGPCLKAKPTLLKTLKDAGVNAVSLANNHILDYGEQGVLDTLAYTQEYAVEYFGGGENAEEAKKPLIVTIKEKKVGFLSFAEHEFNLATEETPGANWFNPYKSLPLIAQVKKECDFVIVLYHGGIEHYQYPSPLLQEKCRAMVDAGADAVFCQHSHCIGTMETYEGKPIIYGQGNTIFGYRVNSPSWNEGFVFTLILNLEKVGVEIKTLQAGEGGIAFASNEKNQTRITEFLKDSKCLSDKKVLQEKWNAFCKKQEPLVLPNIYGKSRVFNKLNRLFGNKLVSMFMTRKKLRVTMAYIRCEAHHEVVQTILENKTNGR